MDVLTKVIAFFVKNTTYKKEEIVLVKEIHWGFSNCTFLVKLKNKQCFQVRFPFQDNRIDRLQEKKLAYVCQPDLFLYFDQAGNFIKKWIQGVHPAFKQQKDVQIKALAQAIKAFHAKKISNVTLKAHDYFAYHQHQHYFSQADMMLYRHIVKKLNQTVQCPSHNDLNPKNMIYLKKKQKMVLIDYEWCRYNNQYWDLASFWLSVGFQKGILARLFAHFPHLNQQLLKECVFVVLVFARLWCYNMPKTLKLQKYSKMIEFLWKKWSFYEVQKELNCLP